MPFPPLLAEDPDTLTREFPRWLEKVSARLPGTVVLVIDAADQCQVFQVFFVNLVCVSSSDSKVSVKCAAV